MPKVSIVMPVYNTEKYLSEALSSVINQTMKDIEIICVDDASSDNSYSILSRFAGEDDRIIVIHNTSNKGVAVSRNIGLEKSQGEYVCFLDSDDIFAENLIEAEYTAICKYDADIAVVHAVQFHENILEGQPRKSPWNEQCVSMNNAEDNLLKKWYIAPWNKMYKRKFISGHNLLYPDWPVNEDVYFGMLAVLLAGKITLVESKEPMVFYRIGSGIVSARTNAKKACVAFEEMRESMIGYGIWNKYHEAFLDLFYDCMLYGYQQCKDEEANRQAYEYIAQEGLQKLGFLELEKQQFKDEKLYQRLWNCLHYSYNSGWFRFKRYDDLLEWNKDKIVAKLKWCNENDKTLVIWGAAARAEAFINLSCKNKCTIQYIVDKDVLKQGEKICGMKIQKFEDISNLVDVVLVLRSSYYEEIENTVKKVNAQIDVWDFEKYLLQ